MPVSCQLRSLGPNLLYVGGAVRFPNPALARRSMSAPRAMFPHPDPGGTDMDLEERARLIARLRKIQELYLRPGTAGERMAAKEALDRLRARLGLNGENGTSAGFDHRFHSRRPTEPEISYRFSIHDPWKRKVFRALLDKYGLPSWRRPRQHRSTVMAQVRPSFVDETLWPEFARLCRTLDRELASATATVISSIRVS